MDDTGSGLPIESGNIFESRPEAADPDQRDLLRYPNLGSSNAPAATGHRPVPSLDTRWGEPRRACCADVACPIWDRRSWPSQGAVDDNLYRWFGYGSLSLPQGASGKPRGSVDLHRAGLDGVHRRSTASGF